MGYFVISINAFETFIPDLRVPVEDLVIQTSLPKEMLSIFKMIYGLRYISIYDKGDLESLISKPLQKIVSQCNDLSSIKYLVYVHTTGVILPYGDTMLHRLKEKFHLQHTISFSMTLQKCASYFKALEMLTVLLAQHPSHLAIVLTGEVAFSPQLRVVPRSSIVGDAASAALFSFSGNDHQLLAVENKFIMGYAKGIYLSNNEIQLFDSLFIQSITTVINKVVLMAKLTLKKITLILPHNVNYPTWKKISVALNFPLEKIFLGNISKIGHAFCSDHMINLQSALLENRLKKGDYYVMAGCGMGFYLSAALFRY